VNKWDERCLALAEHISTWSRDPSTKTGAVIVRPDRTIASVGYNGFPRGVSDAEHRYLDRAVKYAMVVHAEVNAILHSKEPLKDSSIYVWPWQPCSTCAGVVIQSGIKRVVSPKLTPERRKRWGVSMVAAQKMLYEAGVELVLVDA